MARSGKESWEKYFQGRTTKTTLKTSSKIYNSSGLIIGEISPDESITVLPNDNYKSKVDVLYGSSTVTIQFSSIRKPINNKINIKPQDLNLTDQNLNLIEFKTKTQSSISAHIKVPELKQYLNLLVEYWSGSTEIEYDIKSLYDDIKDELPILEISKDFAEVLGPMACVQYNFFTSVNVTFSTSSNIWISSKQNYPLTDYNIDNWCISAKSGKLTNTIKPKDLLHLLERNPKKMNKWKKSKEFQILEKLHSKSTLYGPPIAVKDHLKNNWKHWVINNSYFQNLGSFSDVELMYECEKVLKYESKEGDIDYTNLLIDSIEGEILYIKYTLSSHIGQFEPIFTNNFKNRPYLRSKNGYMRASDKMGIQI